MLEIKHLTITKTTEVMIPDLSFTLNRVKYLTLMGASGTGKSTVLNWLIGELDPVFSAKRQLWLNGSRRDRLPIEGRRIGILFQDDLLFPHGERRPESGVCLTRTVQELKPDAMN